ncbi:DUF6216 family protein [Serratia fonticola]|uniref:DUF6216 family protein n=1 Tax=Serratia fonticola TaxID=47917 RepID=UPI003AABCA8E
MNTQFDTFISPLLSIIDNKFILFPFIFIMMISSLYYIKRKAKSGFSIVNRFWAFWLGYKKESKHDFINEIIEIEKFNYHYNTDAVSIKQKKKFEDWIKKYELNFRIIAKLKRNLIIDTLKIKKIKKVIPTLTFLSLFLPLFLFFAALVVAIKPAGLINISNTGWFWFNKKEAIEYNVLGGRGNSWVITPQECEKKTDIVIKLPPQTIDIICESFNSQRSLEYIDTLVAKQRWAFGIFSVIFLFFVISLFTQTIYLLITYDARKMVFLKIKKHRSDRLK